MDRLDVLGLAVDLAQALNRQRPEVARANPMKAHGFPKDACEACGRVVVRAWWQSKKVESENQKEVILDG